MNPDTNIETYNNDMEIDEVRDDQLYDCTSPNSNIFTLADANSVDDSKPNQHILCNKTAEVDLVNSKKPKTCYVNICIPLIYVHTDDIPGKDKIVPNLRVIDYAYFQQLMNIAVKIPTANNVESTEISDQLIKFLMHSNVNKDCDQTLVHTIANVLDVNGRLSKDFDLEDDYVDLTTECISFDIIRHYKTVPRTGILISAEPVTIDGYQLYSQLPRNNHYENVLKVRKQTNDTDYMRMQYYLSCFEKMLTFQPGYCLSRTMKVSNLALFYLCLCSGSIPISTYSHIDIKSNIIGYVIDLIARSRCMQSWLRDESSQKLIKDMVKNYDPDNHIIQLCQLPTPKQRAKYVLNLLAKKPELSEFAKQLNYDILVSLLQKNTHTIEGETYYLFDQEFLTNLVTKIPFLSPSPEHNILNKLTIDQ